MPAPPAFFSPYFSDFVDPYYGDLTAAIIGKLTENDPTGFEVKEFEGELSTAEEVSRFLSRLTMMPQLLVNVRGGEVPNDSSDSSGTSYRERVNFEVLCCVSNTRNIREQRETAMGAVGFCRRRLAGFRFGTDYVAPCFFQYAGWETVSNEPGLTVVSVSFFIETNTTADAE